VVLAAFAAMPGDELVARLTNADIAFAELNDMAVLSRHAHLRRITVDTVAGPVAFPAPGAILRGQARHYGAVSALGAHTQSVLAELADHQVAPSKT